MRGTFWTTRQVQLLTELYPHHSTAYVAERVGRSEKSCYTKAKQLGLKKTPEYLASPAACRLRRGDNTGAETRFKPGNIAWNKGMKGLQIGGKATQFKPGHRGGKALERYQPIGTERISKDGYLERKINDDMPLQKRWRAVHLVLWEEANGPVPKGHAVVFKDGDKSNITLDNLELISRAELMRRNTYHRYGKEIAQAIQLKGAITRKINRMEKA